MKGTMKRIVSILLALALVITSLNYTPKTVSAAEFSLTSEGKTYTINLNGDGGIIGFAFQGAFDNVRFAFAWGEGGTLTPTISSNGETVATLTALNSGGSIWVANGLNDIATGTYDFTLVGGGTIEGKSVTGTLTITAEGEDGGSEEDSSEEDEKSDSIYRNLEYKDITNSANAAADSVKNSQYALNGDISIGIMQFEGDMSYIYFNNVSISGSGILADAAFTNIVVNGNAATTKVDGAGVKLNNAASVLTYEYNVVEIYSANGSADIIIWCPNNVGKGTYEKVEIPPTTEAPFEDGAELLKNTTFADLTEWNAPAGAVPNRNGSVSVTVPAKDGSDNTNYSTQLVDNGIKLTEGKWYVATVTITSDVARSFQLMIQSDGADGGNWEVINKTDNNGTFSVEAGVPYTYTTKFQANGVLNNYLYGVMMGYVGAPSDAANVTISNVSLKGYNDEPTIETPEPGTSTLKKLKDVNIYNYVESNGGFKVYMEDLNVESLTDYTAKYYLTINGQTITVNAETEEAVDVDLSGLDLVEGTEYDVTMYAEYVSGDTTATSPAATSKFLYKTTKTTVKNTGLAQIHFTSTGGKTAADAGFYNGSENSKPKIPSVITVINADGTIDEVDFGTANVRGNSTANAAKKPYNFKFDTKLDVQGMGKAKKWSLLANLFDKTLMRNQIGMDFQRMLEESRGIGQVYTSEIQPVDLYIDGEYAGTYSLVESVEVGGPRVDINIDGVDENTNETIDPTAATTVTIGDTSYTVYDVLLELGNDNRLDDEAYYFEGVLPGGGANGKIQWAINEPAVGDDSVYSYHPTEPDNKPEFVKLTRDYIQAFETALSGGDYDTFSQFMDVDSFVDFYITSEYFMTKDISFSSTRFYIKSGKIYAGPLWDVDLSSGNNGSNLSTENFYAQNFEWFKALMANETFKTKVIERYTELQPEIRSIYATGGKVDQAYNTVVTSANANYTEAYNTKWSSTPAYTGWGYGYVYGNGGFYNQLEQNLTVEQAYQRYGVYGSVEAHDNYEDYITNYKTWLKDRNEWLIEKWGIEITTGLEKNDEGDVIVAWDAVEGATGYAITYTPAIDAVEAASFNLFSMSRLVPFATGEETTIYVDANTTSYNFTDNGIRLANNTPVTVAYTTDTPADATANWVEAVADEATAHLSLLNRVTVDGLNATIVTNVTNSGTASAENVEVVLKDSTGAAVGIQTIALVEAGATATVTWERTETAGSYTYSVDTGLLTSGVSYTCDSIDSESLVYVEDANLTAKREGATYAVLGTIPDTNFRFIENGYFIETGAADQAIYIRLNGETLASNETGNSAMNYTVNFTKLEYDTTNVIQIEYVDRASDMITMTTRIQTVYINVGEKPAEKEPDLTTVIANTPDVTGTDGWILQAGGNGSSTVNSTETLNYYIAQSYYVGGENNKNFLNGNIYGYFAKGTSIPYGGGDDNTVKGEAFGISSDTIRNGVDSVWISDGTNTEKLTDKTADLYWNPVNTDVLTLTATKFTLAEDETEKVYYVTVRLADGTDHSWPIKVAKVVEVEPSDIADPTKWVEFGSKKAANGDTFYVSQDAIDAGYVKPGTVEHYGIYNAPDRAAYQNHMPADANTLSWTSAVGAGSWKSVWVRNSDGITKYENDNVNASFNSDCMHVNQNVFALAEGDTEEIFTITVRGTADYTFKIKVVKGETETESDSESQTETTTEGEVVEKPATPDGLVNIGGSVWNWGAVAGMTYNFYINGDLVASGLVAGYYDASEYFSDAETGEYTISLTAVNADNVESDPATDTYTKVVVDTTTPETSSEEDSSDVDDEIDYANLEFVECQNDANFAVAFVEGAKTEIDYSLNQGNNFYVALKGLTVKANFQKVTCNGNVQESPSAGANFWIPITDLVENSYNDVEVVDALGNTYHFVIRYGTPAEETTTEAPTVAQPDIDVDAIDDWVQVNGTSANNATVWMSQAVVDILNTGLLGFYAGGTVNNGWGNLGATTNMYKTPFFGTVTKGGNAASIVIDGIEYTSDDKNVLISGDCVFINQELLDAAPGETKYYKITATGTTTGGEGTFVIKVVGEQAPDISKVTIDEWIEVVANENGTDKGADGSTYYYAKTNAVTNGNMIQLLGSGEDAKYGAAGTTLADVPVFAISVKSGNNPASIWVTTVDSEGTTTSKKLTEDLIYINGDCIQIAQSAFDLGSKLEETYYVTMRYSNGTDATLPLKVVAPEPEATWSDWTAMNDASGANTVDYYYATLSSNTIGVHADTRELPNTIIAVFSEGLSSAKLNGVDVTFNGAGVEINKSELVEGQEYVLEVVNADPANVKTASIKFKYEPAPTYAPTGVTVTTNRGNDITSTEDDGAIVSWVNSDDAVAEGCNYVIELKSGDTVLATAQASSLNTTAGFDLSTVEYGTYDVVITTYDSEGNTVDTQTITYKYLDPYAVDSTVNFNNTLWEKFRYQTVTWTNVEAAKEYAIYADGVLVGTTTDLTYNVDAYNYANGTNANGQATTVGTHTTTVVAVFDGDAVPESLDAVTTGRVMGTNDFALNVNYIYGKGTDAWNDSGVDSVWNFTVSEAVAGQISEGASVTVDYDATGAANLTILDNGKHDGADQEWTIKASIYDEAVLEGEKINLTFDIIGPAELVGQSIAIKCCSEEVGDDGNYTGADAIYKEASYTFEELTDEEGNVIGSVIHYSESFDSTNSTYDLLFGLGELEPTTLTLTDASATKVYGVTSVSASGIVNTENTADNSMYIAWETNVPDLLKSYYTYTLKVYDADGNVVIEDDNAKSGTIYEGMNADLVDGTYRVEVSSVYDGTITATVETTATIDVEAALQPDLVVSDISIVDPSIEYRIDDEVRFNVTMTNIGSADATLTAGNITMWLYVKNPTNGALENVNYYIKDYVDGSVTLAKGESITKSVVYTITDKHCLEDYLFTFTARADADGTIEESNETNNEYSKVFMFNPALQVVSFANNGEDISASWPATTDSTVTSYLIEYTDSEGNKVKASSSTANLVLPEGTYFMNDSYVGVTAVCNDGTQYLYAEGTARADLVIEKLEPVGGVAYVGEEIKFVSVVKNIGVAPATKKTDNPGDQFVTVYFTTPGIDGLTGKYGTDIAYGEGGTPIYTTLNPNEASTINITDTTYKPTAVGTESFDAVADDINRILELNDIDGSGVDNNRYTVDVVVLNPSEVGLNLNEPEGEASYVSATWMDNNILETSDYKLTVEGYQVTYTNADGETKTVNVGKDFNTYVFTEELKNNTDVIISALYTEFKEKGYIQIAKTKALADLVIVEDSIVIKKDGEVVDTPATEREYQISFTFKNIGTASIPAAVVPEDDPFLEYGKWILGNLQCSPSEGFECVATPANYSTEGIVAGASDTITFESVTFNREGNFTLIANIDYPGHVEAEEGGYITESNEDNNSETKDITVEFIQNREMDWTRLVYDDGTGTEYLFPVASGSQDAYIDYKILSTTETNYHYEDIINKYVGYNGANMSIGFQPAKTIVYFDDGASSYTKFEFAQVPNWNEFEFEYKYDEQGNLVKTVKLDENGDPVEVTPDGYSKELVWVTLPTKATTIYDADGNVIKNTDVSDSPMGYNGNGYNFFVGNFGLYKCYLMKFTTPVPALDANGNYTYDENNNMLFEYETVTDAEGNEVKQLKYDEIIVAFRVTDDTVRTNNWMQSLASDGVSNPNTLPIPYCGGDSYVNGDADGIPNTVKDIIYAEDDPSTTDNEKHKINNTSNEKKSIVIDDTTVFDDLDEKNRGHEDTEAERNYETIGAIWYDASDILLSSVSVYNGNWLSIATSEYLEFSKGDQDNNGTKNLRVGIARAVVDPAQNNKFVGYATDFVVTDPNKEGTHLGIQGTNTVHVGLPWLLEELPTHSDRVDENGNALPKDRDYYWIRVWADITAVQETIIVGEGENREYKQMANYIDIPIVVYYDVPQIQPAQNVTAITSYDDNDQEIFSLTWNELAEMGTYGYKYKVFYTDEDGKDVDISLDLAKSSGLDTSSYVEGTEYYFDSPQALTSNEDLYDKVATYDSNTNTVTGSLKVVAYWCEQTIPVTVDIQPPHEKGWYSFDGESTINISAGKSKPVEINGYMSYYYNRSDNHSSGTIGYNGYFVSLNGNTRWFASNSKVSVATGTDDRFVSRSDMTTVYDSLYSVVNENQHEITGGLAKTTVTDTEADLGLVFKSIEDEDHTGYVAGQLQIESKTLFQATNHVTWYLVKVETPILDSEGNETDDVRVAYIMMESIVEVGGDVSVRGFQMNTDTSEGGVSEYSPSFRVVSRSSKLINDNTGAVELYNDGINKDLDKPLYEEGTLNSAVEAIVAQGTIFGLDTEGIDDRLMVNYDVETNTATPIKVQKTDENGELMVDEEGNAVYYDDVYQIQTTAGGILDNWSGSSEDADKAKYTYYAMTFKPNVYTVKSLSNVYAIRAYMVTEEGDIYYEEETENNDPVKSASVYSIAKTLYSNGNNADSKSRMSSAEDHEFLYNNVLNVTHIYNNYYSIATEMFKALGVTSSSDERYKYVNYAYKDLYYYARFAEHYNTGDSYALRGKFVSKKLVDGEYNEYKLLPLLNGVKKNSTTDYATVADWIYNEVDHTNGFYEKVEWATPNTDGTVNSGNQS